MQFKNAAQSRIDGLQICLFANTMMFELVSVTQPSCIGATENTRPDNAASDKTAVRIDCCLYCRSNSGVRARLNRTCLTISELNPVCHDSTAALTVACSFCVQSVILLALIRSPYSRGTTTAAATAAAAARTKTRTDRRPWQQQQLQGRRNRQRQPRQLLRSVPRGATCWLRTGAVWTCAVL